MIGPSGRLFRSNLLGEKHKTAIALVQWVLIKEAALGVFFIQSVFFPL